MNVERILISFLSEFPSALKGRRAFLIACSGGPDSTALAVALSRLKDKCPAKFYIGHVNHHLRGKASDKDAWFVKALAKRLGRPYVEKTARISSRHSGNLEEKARIKRYKLLGEMAKRFNCQAILTGHHLDDQAETVLMNLFRGSGVDGLAGMREWRVIPECGIPVGRPFLNISKKEIVQYLRQHAQAFRTDQSNRDIRLFRNWIRLDLLPRLEKKSPGVKHRLSRLATILRGENEFWDRQRQAMLPRITSSFRNARLLDLKRLLRYPLAAQRRFLRGLAGDHLLTFERVEGWRKWMLASPTGSRIWQLKRGWKVERLSKSKGAPSARLFWIRQTA